MTVPLVIVTGFLGAGKTTLINSPAIALHLRPEMSLAQVRGVLADASTDSLQLLLHATDAIAGPGTIARVD